MSPHISAIIFASARSPALRSDRPPGSSRPDEGLGSAAARCSPSCRSLSAPAIYTPAGLYLMKIRSVDLFTIFLRRCTRVRSMSANPDSHCRCSPLLSALYRLKYLVTHKKEELALSTFPSVARSRLMFTLDCTGDALFVKCTGKHALFQFLPSPEFVFVPS